MYGRSITTFSYLLLVASWALCTPAHAALLVSPSAVVLDNPEATQQLLVRSSAVSADSTRQATYQVLDPGIATVDAAGLVQPRAEGRTTILIRNGAEETRVPVEVPRLEESAPGFF